MKKVIIAAVLAVFASAVLFADAQPNMYVKTVPIVKIYAMKEGYRIVYRMTDLNLSEFYVPLSWFDPSVGKAVLVIGDDPTYPYFSIFWKDGKYDFVRLYVKRDQNDPSWGLSPAGFDTQGKFNIDTLDLKWQ